jgi:hypothetical protein
MLPILEMKSESKPPKRQVQFFGICADAKALGVSREHLYRVLTGRRTSQSLMKRYLELRSKRDKPPDAGQGQTIIVRGQPKA